MIRRDPQGVRRGKAPGSRSRRPWRGTRSARSAPRQSSRSRVADSGWHDAIRKECAEAKHPDHVFPVLGVDAIRKECAEAKCPSTRRTFSATRRDPQGVRRGKDGLPGLATGDPGRNPQGVRRGKGEWIGTKHIKFLGSPYLACHCEPVVLRAANQNLNDCQWQSYLNVAHAGVAIRISKPSPPGKVARASPASARRMRAGICWCFEKLRENP